MSDFDYNKPFKTKNGQAARLVEFNPDNLQYPARVRVEGMSGELGYTTEGNYFHGRPDPRDLVNVEPVPVIEPTSLTSLLGIGGAPLRATTLPTESKERKQYPIASGVLDYFPDALVAIAQLSWRGNEQHNPGKPLHWDRSKSADEADTLIRHFLQRGTLDTDKVRHSAKMAWRALALLQKEIEAEQAKKI